MQKERTSVIIILSTYIVLSLKASTITVLQIGGGGVMLIVACLRPPSKLMAKVKFELGTDVP